MTHRVKKMIMPSSKEVSYEYVGYQSDTEQLVVGGGPHKERGPSHATEEHSPITNVPFKKKTWGVTVCILLTEMCERLTYYSIVANFPLFCTSNLDIKQTDATTYNQLFGGFVYLIPIIGGYLADSYFGRFRTILSSCGLYLIGLVLLPVAAIDFESLGLDAINVGAKQAFFFTALFFVALGTGGIKANVGPFGAEQVESMGKDAVKSFFNWFYWVINIGALIAYLGVAYIQQEVSFGWGYTIPLMSMLVAVFIFVMVKSYYIRTDPKGSVLTVAWQIVRSNGCCKGPPPSNTDMPYGSEQKIFARTKKSFGGNFQDHMVDGLSSVVKVIPFVLLVVMYWAIYAQMANTFLAQAERMDVSLGSFNIPAAALNMFNTLSIILLIPVIERLIYPCFDRIGFPLTYLKRIGIGFVFAAAGMVVAGVVEIERKEQMQEPGGWIEQTLADEKFNASSMSVLVQIPQFALIGISEIFTSVTTLEFAYNQAPVAMQGLLTGLFLASSGMGNWLSAAIMAIVQEATADDPWWGDDINDTKMENLMFLMAGLMILNLLVFMVVAHYYTYQDPDTFEEGDHIDGSSDEEGTRKGSNKEASYRTFSDNDNDNDNESKMTPYP